ncbi:MAG: hypothetical protein ACJA16_004734 [Akkermansiaceae bacterium]|jgi:hypothetical protein|tara:strand:- start:5952 stop:7088 length:1137 start_codon:yes stop_codon:yes gene_type:complete
MKRNPKSLIVLCGAFLFTSASAQEKVEPKEGQSKVQIAILLDTSGSMSGLIEQTKTQLWKVVNTFIGAKQNGQIPFVEVALYEYGAGSKNPNFIRSIQPLTRDLDQISEDLFALNTSGSQEYCGAVIAEATNTLKWDHSPDVYKAIFIAGNEPFTQGSVDSSKACKDAIAKGIIVNTIHCGNEQEGINGGWKSGALLADGSFLVINHNAAVVHIETPQDSKIVALNEKLNKTYIAYGKQGARKLASQSAQDGNALKKKESGAAVGRAVTKASKNYWNASWDLVDASKEKTFDWSKVKDEDLPAEMRKLDLEGRKKFVARKETERGAVQKKIQALNEARKEFVAEKRRESAVSGEETLDVAVTKTVRDQASKKGYQFKK